MRVKTRSVYIFLDNLIKNFFFYFYRFPFYTFDCFNHTPDVPDYSLDFIHFWINDRMKHFVLPQSKELGYEKELIRFLYIFHNQIPYNLSDKIKSKIWIEALTNVREQLKFHSQSYHSYRDYQDLCNIIDTEIDTAMDNSERNLPFERPSKIDAAREMNIFGHAFKGDSLIEELKNVIIILKRQHAAEIERLNYAIINQKILFDR